jgi:hypothetical protein
MSTANPLWGAPRIHGELLKLGIQISQALISDAHKYSPSSVVAIWERYGTEPDCVRLPHLEQRWTSGIGKLSKGGGVAV